MYNWEKKLTTQLQPTPTLYGKDAEEVLKQIYSKPTIEDREKAEKRRAMFSKIKKKGLR